MMSITELKINKCITYARTLIGVRYTLWKDTMEDTGPFSYAENEVIPSLTKIKDLGINCVGVINLMRPVIWD